MIGRWVRGHKGLVGTAATAAIAIVVTVVVAFLLITRSRDVAKQRAAEKAALADEKAALADEKAALADGLRNALNSVETERNHAIQESRKAFQSLSDFYLERGRALVNGRDPKGLLWMVRRLATAPADDAVKQYQIRSNLSAEVGQLNMLKAIFSSSDQVWAVAFSPDGKTILTRSGDNTARLWNAADGCPAASPWCIRAPS